MSTTQHPLTDIDAAEMWDAHVGHTVPWEDWYGGSRQALASMLRAAFDAGREHERTTPADPHHGPRPWQDCTREDIREGDLVERRTKDLVIVGVAHRQDGDGDWWTKDDLLLTCGDRWPLRRIPATTTEKGTPMTETTTPAEPLARTLLAVPEGYGAPHHDVTRIKAEDYVMQLGHGEDLRYGKAHYQDDDGDWWSEDDHLLTWERGDRPDAVTVWPAPTPPAVEVEMPSEHPAHLLDVEGWDGERFAYMALDGGGHWCGVDQDGVARAWPLRWIAAATLPDGTRARRDGEHENGEPRFVKTQEEA